MSLTVNSALIAAQAQTYAAKSGAAKAQPRSFAPEPVERLAARSGETAVRVEISAEAADTDRSRRDRPQAPDARGFAREAPLKGTQQDAGTRPARPGATLDIRI